MAGLTSPTTPPAPAPSAPPAPAPANPAPAGADPNAPPAAAPGGSQPQQPQGPPLTQGPVDPELLKKFNANCMNIVTAGLGQIIKMVTQSQDKVDALAHSAVLTVMRVEDSLEQSGATLNLNMTFEAGAETVTDIADAMEKAGVYTYQQKELDAAFLRAVDQYRVIRQQQGRLDPATFQQIIQQMKQAQSSGTLDQQFPGLTDYAKQAQKAAKPAYKPQQGAAAPAAAAPAAAPDDGSEDSEDGDDPEQPIEGGDDTSGVAPQAQGIGNNFPAHMIKKREKGAPASKAKSKTKAKRGVKAPAKPVINKKGGI